MRPGEGAPAAAVWILLVACLAASRVAGGEEALRSPEVDADGRVTFRLRAPEAAKALVVIEGEEPAPMARDETGAWVLTTDPLPPDFYAYFFVVDGLPRSDTLNPLGKPVVTGGVQSLAHVPGPKTLSWEVADVPRGTVHRHSYESAAVGEEREYFVYTPPGYEPDGERSYPVLYLLHGVGDDASAWRTAGRVDVILDNLIARGRAQPMLVVNPLGYGFADPAGRLWDVVTHMPEHRRSLDVWSATLVEEILPRVEAAYRAAPDRESRAIAGLSMGGSQALYVGLRQLDRFAWVGSFSGALMMFSDGFDRAFAGVGEAANARLRLLWLSCGKDDFVLGANREYKAWLESKGLRFTWSETPGAHTWGVWRRNLTEFASLLFRQSE